LKIAVSGKGGSGKTTIAGTLARCLARTGSDVLAIDADSNPNLAITLGIPQQKADQIPPVPSSIVKQGIGFSTGSTPILAMALERILAEHGARASDGVGLLVMGSIDHAGSG